MNKFTRLLTAVGLSVALLGCGSALAAEDSGIAVQLDGQALTFTDAVPQVQSERTFLPFRAVFEALGAQVDWNADTGAISAVRDGKTVTMLPGSTDASVEDGGVVTAIQMDVAPYAAADENGVWRTYVPVRFAAQAFDCVVGWDQERATVILVDSAKLLDEAMEGKNFTYLEKLAAYSEKYNEGVWDVDMTVDGSMSLLGAEMPLAAAVKGVMADGEKLEMDMNMKMDMTNLASLVSAMGQTGLSEEDLAMLAVMKEKGVDLSMRGDLGLGALYMNVDSELLADAGMSADDWYKLDMAAMMEQSGVDWVELMETSKSVDYVALVKSSLSSVTVTDSTAAYEQVKTTVETVLAALSDEGFVKEGDQYTAILDLEENGVTVTVVFVMTMKDDAVTAYVVGMGMTAEEDGVTVTMDMNIAVDENDQMLAEVKMDMAGLMAMELNMAGGYAPGKTAPATEPPAGANVVDFMERMGAEE